MVKSSALKPNTADPFKSVEDLLGKVLKTAFPISGKATQTQATPAASTVKSRTASAEEFLKSGIADTLPDYAGLLRATMDKKAEDKYSETVNELEKYMNLNKNEIEQSYNEKLSELDNSKRQSERNAALEYERLLKLLPEYLESSGLSKLGVAQSTLLAAKNDYISSLGEIAKSYGIDKAEYASAKDSSISSVMKDYYTKLLSAKDEKAKALTENEKSNNQTLEKNNTELSSSVLKNALSVITNENSRFASDDEKLTYLMSLKPYMTQNDWQRVIVSASEYMK